VAPEPTPAWRSIEIASVDVLADGSIANRQSTLVRPGMAAVPTIASNAAAANGERTSSET
jgi:hypothetical protein